MSKMEWPNVCTVGCSSVITTPVDDVRAHVKSYGSSGSV